MKFSKLIAITGQPGLFVIRGQRSNGFIVKSLLTGKSKFYATRSYAFSVLSNISMYTTTDDSRRLDWIMRSMKALEDAGTPPPSPNAEEKDLMDYLKKALPDCDETRIYKSDIKKLVKWYNLLKEQDSLDFSELEEFEKEQEEREKAAAEKEKKD